MKKYLILFLFTIISFAQQKTFTNPILPAGADPYSTYYKGYYYYTNTLGNKLVLWKTKDLSDIKNAESKVIWTPSQNTNYSAEIWAPEFHIIKGKWYCYFAADNGDNNTHRMYVLENKSSDPFKGKFEFKGKIAAKTDKWAIDGNVFEHKNQLYMIWAGWEGDTNGQQNIYIAKMKNPLEIEGDRVMISAPTNDWETHGALHDDVNPPQVNVNEGPQFLERKGKIFIVFSASGCWTDFYALGLLTFNGGDNLLDANAWKKSPEPIFKQSDKNKVYAPGHNSFFKSPDGKEDWILYHANSNPGEGCGNKRSPRMQKIYWDANGFPVLGEPVSEETKLAIPSK
ncbi:glycoside hydrolase family 43 protein [Flavobacterium sp. KACC 22758]|uniref:glycoside hydrolase family 43 protein n=1 Tax=Flavobacterium sp. KACC 22758 TaxID=3025667 RepID=UPI0023670F83|nr:glycoside hydrolase family 43 protein [Flavobacterium sp. KACC 22758]WDF60768.1 glycoside hydrolase family 43 protein [Flavobacterium sp. KACC 22758]